MRDMKVDGKSINPPQEFYAQLAKYAARTPKLTKDKAQETAVKRQGIQRTINAGKEVPLEIPRELYDELSRWEKYSGNSTDFYGNLRLSIAYEALGTIRSHQRAMFFFKRAYCIEPRVLFSRWMSDNFEWNNEYDVLVQRILDDPLFREFLS